MTRQGGEGTSSPTLTAAPVASPGRLTLRALLVAAPGPERDRLVDALRCRAIRVTTAGNARRAPRQLRTSAPDVVVVDLDLADGVDICHRLSRSTSSPVVAIAAERSDEDVFRAIAAGAADYVTRPWDGWRLELRIRTALRRAPQWPRLSRPESVEVGPVSIQPASRTVLVRGEPVPFARVEYEVLLLLASRPGEVCTRQDLIATIWGGRGWSGSRSLDTHIKRIRAKVELDHNRPEHVLTVRGVGYCFAGDGAGARIGGS